MPFGGGLFNISFYDRGVAEGAAQATANAASSLPGVSLNVTMNIPLVSNGGQTWVQEDERYTRGCSSDTSLNLPEGIFNTITVNPTYTYNTSGFNPQHSTGCTVYGTKNGSEQAISPTSGNTYNISGCTAIRVHLTVSTTAESYGPQMTFQWGVGGSATLSS